MNSPYVTNRPAPRWCRECGHESHDPRRCLYRMSTAHVLQTRARGGRLPADLRCRCDEPRETVPTYATR